MSALRVRSGYLLLSLCGMLILSSCGFASSQKTGVQTGATAAKSVVKATATRPTRVVPTMKEPLKVPANAPKINPPRVDASMAYDGQQHAVVLFGGSDLADTWLWKGQGWQKAHPATNPPGRSDASMAYDAATGLVVLFGGVSATGLPLNDTWTWNGTNWTQQRPASVPSPRALAHMSYDAAHKNIVLFGGEIAGSDQATPYVNETWLWNGDNWIQQKPRISPPAMLWSSMSYDADQQYSLLLGSPSGTANDNQTWSWNGSIWTQLHPAHTPPGRDGASMVYDGAHNQLLLFAGVNNGNRYTRLSDTWSWNGDTWIQQQVARAPTGDNTNAAYDAEQNNVLAYVVSMQNKQIGPSETWSWNGHSWSNLL